MLRDLNATTLFGKITRRASLPDGGFTCSSTFEGLWRARQASGKCRNDAAGHPQYVGNTAVNGAELHGNWPRAPTVRRMVKYMWTNDDGRIPEDRIPRQDQKFGKEYYAGVGYRHTQFPFASARGCTTLRAPRQTWR